MTQTLQIVWPITDLDQTRHELETTAIGDLPDILFDAGLQQVGDLILWDLAWPAEGGVQLVAEFEVKPWIDPVKARRRAVVA